MPSHSKQLLLVGSYANANEPSIHALVFDSVTQEIVTQATFTGIENPSFVIVHPNGRFLYAVSETAKGEVWAFELQHAPHKIAPLNKQSSAGESPCHLVIDHSGRWLVASNYSSGNITLYPILDNGSLGPQKAHHQHHGSGPNKERQEAPHAHSSIFTPDNRHLIVADLGIDQLVIYTFAEDSGELLPHTTTKAAPGSGPRHFAFHPNGRFLYTAHELDSTVTLHHYDTEQGTLILAQTISSLPADVTDSYIADIHLSKSGQQLYISNRGDNSIAIFTVAEDGQLSPAGYPSCGGDWPRNFAISPDGRFLFVTNRRTNQVSILAISTDRLTLSPPLHQIPLTAPSCVQPL